MSIGQEYDKRQGGNNTIIGYDSNVGEYCNECLVLGTNSLVPAHSKNLILIGQNIVIPEGFPRENAIYIGAQTDELFMPDNRDDWFETSRQMKLAMEKMTILAKHLQENPDNKRIFYNVNGTFRDLMKEVMTMKEKVDILWDEHQRRNSTNTYSL